jgi:hypothetical protein
MRCNRILIYGSLVIFLGGAFNAFAMVVNTTQANPPPVDSSQGSDATPDNGQAPNTAIIPSLTQPVAPMSMSAPQASSPVSFPWGTLLFGLLGIGLCVAALLKLLARSKQRDVTK